MRIVIEIKGERHRLLKGLTKMEDPCDKCSLQKECKGRFNKNQKLIQDVCGTTYSGFRKIWEAKK